MASLNLVPNPTVLVVQAGVFLVNYAIIKKLYITPYLKIRDKREALTVGSKDDATRALAECDELSGKIESRLIAAAEEAKKAREVVREGALAKRQGVVQAATVESKSYIENVERQIQQELAAERTKIPATVAALTEEVYKLALA